MTRISNLAGAQAVGTVMTVFGRSGPNIVAQTNDYTWAQINKAVSSIADITTKSHTLLTDIGTNTHAQIDTALVRLANTSGTNTGDVTLATNHGLGLSGQVLNMGTPSSITSTSTNSVTTTTHTHTADSTIAKTANVLALDQTTPQSIINGKPTIQGFQFNTNPTVGADSEGKLYYDTTYKTLDLDTFNNIHQHIGHQMILRAINSGATINVGDAVYLSGASGVYPTVALAQANNVATSFVVGLAAEQILNGAQGSVIIRGHAHDINTNAYTSGDNLYLSDTVAGGLQNTVPAAPNIEVRIGRVVVKDASVGSIYVNPSGVNRLTDLSDVTVTSPAVDQVLRYNGSEWINGSATTSSAGPGIDFFSATPVIVSRTAPAGISQDGTAGNGIQINTLAKVPVTTAEQTQTGLASADTRAYAAWKYDTALGRTSIDAGIWTFQVYSAISTASGTNTITRGIYQVVPVSSGSVTFSGVGANSRTATITSGQFTGTYFVPNATNTTASYIELTSGAAQGIYQITASGTVNTATVTVPTGFNNANANAVSFNIWNKLFNQTSPNITATGTNYALQTFTATEPAFTVAATDKFGSMSFFTSTAANKTVTTTYDGTARNSFFTTPLVTLHNNLAGLQGGTATDRWHLSATEGTVTGSGNLVRDNTPTLITPVLGAATATSITASGDLLVKPYVVVGRSGAVDYTCDGTADDVQIQAAINAVQTAGGGIVHIKRGTYDISATLLINGADKFILEGAGRGTILASSITNGTDILQVKNGTGITDGTILRDFRINGTGTDGKGIYFYKCRDTCSIKDVFITTTGGDGLYIESSFNSYYQGVYAYDCVGNGITLVNNNNNVTLVSCKATNNDGIGFNLITATSDLKLIGCDFENNVGSDLYADDIDALLLLGCHTERSTNGNCIQLNDTNSRPEIRNCNISLDATTNAPKGINITGSTTRCIIQGNSYPNLGGSPVFVTIGATAVATEIYDALDPTSTLSDATTTTTLAYSLSGVWTYDQHADRGALVVDSEATSQIAVQFLGKYPLYCTQDISGGLAFRATRNIAEAGSAELAQFINDNSADTQGAVMVQNDGTGEGVRVNQNGNGVALYLANAGTANYITADAAFTVAKSGAVTGGAYNGNTIGAGSTSGTNTGDASSFLITQILS